MLARELGLTVKQLLNTMDAIEIEEWRIYLNPEPWQQKTNVKQSDEIKAAFVRMRDSIKK